VEPQIILVVVAIIFVAALTRSTFGFGEALVAMPLLSAFVDVKFASTLVALCSTLNALAILLSDRRGLEWRSTWRLAVATLVGIPLGVLGVEYFPEIWIQIALALVVIGFALYNLTRPALIQLKTDRLAPVFGLVAGVLGGAYVTFGPPLVIFASLRGWDPRQFRSTLQGVFFPASVFVCLNHFWYGRWNGDVFACLGWGIPLMAAGLWLGWWLNRRFSTKQFKRGVFGLLLLSGIVLVVSVVFDALTDPPVAGTLKEAVGSPANTQTSHAPADPLIPPATVRA